MIELKNIDLTGISLYKQLQKINEEDIEFIEAIDSENSENTIEEFFDCMQTRLGLIEIRFGIKAEEVMEAYTKHLEKIKHRPRKRA